MHPHQKMEEKWKHIWLKALRSGEYDQHRGALCNKKGTAFCCLGVLCNEIAIENKGIDYGFVTNPFAPGLKFNDKHNRVNDAYIPEQASKLVRLPRHMQSTLAIKNDFQRASFEKIADWIEENL